MLHFSYSNVDDYRVLDDPSCIRSTPLFVGAAGGDLRLQPDSPGVDTGTSVGAPADDIDGILRPQGAGFDMGAYELAATIITLSSFGATPANNETTVLWTTSSEIDNAGFNLYRAEGEGQYVRINHNLIPAEGAPAEGASYEFVDEDVQNRIQYSYLLEDVDINGVSTMHGPVNALPRLIYGIGK
ncbi:choice-of-anchor Q domain-containing protein [Thermodesulfobacteriota bacterium]